MRIASFLHPDIQDAIALWLTSLGHQLSQHTDSAERLVTDYQHLQQLNTQNCTLAPQHWLLIDSQLNTTQTIQALQRGCGYISTAPLDKTTLKDWLAGTNPLPNMLSNSYDLIKIGMPAAFEQVFFQSGLLIFLVFLASYGNAAFATYGIGLSILGLMIVIAFSFSISSATLVSQHLGAGDKQGAYRAGWRAMRTCVYIMIAGGALMSVFAEQIARFMIDDPEVIALLVPFTYIISCSLPLMAVEFSMAGALRGAGDTRYPMMVTVFSILLSRILVPFILVQLGASVFWLYATSLLDFGIKSSLNMHRFRKRDWMNSSQYQQLPS